MGAIASRRAAELYGMQVLEEEIADHAENHTRFLILGREPVIPEGEAKTSILIALKDRSDALSQALGAFARHDIALTRIEARPLQGGPWEYLFYIDFIGSTSDDVSKRALDHLGEYAMTLRVLGSYPRFRG